MIHSVQLFIQDRHTPTYSKVSHSRSFLFYHVPLGDLVSHLNNLLLYHTKESPPRVSKF